VGDHIGDIDDIGDIVDVGSVVDVDASAAHLAPALCLASSPFEPPTLARPLKGCHLSWMVAASNPWRCGTAVVCALLSCAMWATPARADTGLSAAAIGAGVGAGVGSVVGAVVGGILGANGAVDLAGSDDAIARAAVGAGVVGLGAGVVFGSIGGAVGGAIDEGALGAVGGGAGGAVGGAVAVGVIALVPAAYYAWGAISGDPAFDLGGALVASAITIAILPGTSLVLLLPAAGALFAASLGVCVLADTCDVVARSVFIPPRVTTTPTTPTPAPASPSGADGEVRGLDVDGGAGEAGVAGEDVDAGAVGDVVDADAGVGVGDPQLRL
jgi:hypothetical protein